MGMEKNVFIMRGLPGSGKNSWIEKTFGPIEDLPKEILVCCADDEHIIDGAYRYRSEYASTAHKKCFVKFQKGLLARSLDFARTIIVNNTNSSLWELAPYYRTAEANDARVEIIHVVCDPITSFKRNVHGVPLGTIMGMHASLLTEKIPKWWKETFVCGDS